MPLAAAAERGVGHGIVGILPIRTTSPSWYADSAPRLAPQPVLRGEVSAEVCVIGGGYTGCPPRWSWPSAGQRGVAGRRGWAGRRPGAMGGQVLSDLACGMDAVRAELAPTARAIWAMTQEAARMVASAASATPSTPICTGGICIAAVKLRQVARAGRLAGAPRRAFNYGLRARGGWSSRRVCLRWWRRRAMSAGLFDRIAVICIR